MRSGAITYSIAAAMLAMLAAGAGPTPAQPDPMTAFQRTWDSEKFQRETVLNRLPAFDEAHPSHPASDLFSLNVERGALVVRTPVQTSPRGIEAKVKIGDSEDWSVVRMQAGPAEKGAAPIPIVFALNRVIFGHQRIDILNLQQPGQGFFNLSMLEITPAGQRSIQLQQQSPILAANFPGNCVLTVEDVAAGQRVIVPLQWSSDNFIGLAGEHPTEVNQYVRPMLHLIDQEAALAPDPMLAFELFADQWPPDPATAAKVGPLVAHLTGGDFHSRLQAQHDLADLGEKGALVLTHLDRSALDAEQNARVDKVLAPYRPVPAKEADKFRSDPEFLVNCLYSDDPVICKAAIAQLETVTKLKLKLDPAADPADRAAAVAAVQKQLVDAKAIHPS